MATSGVTAWTLTVRDIVEQVLGDELGIIGIGRDARANEAEYVMRRLNMLLKEHTNAAHLETQGTVTIPADSSSGTIADNVQDVISARVVSTYERPLTRFGRDEYLMIPNKEAGGEPTCFYVSSQRDNTIMYVWPTPSVETTIKIDYRRTPETVTDLAETIDFPPQYHPALIVKLASMCLGRFGKGISPDTKVDVLNRASELWGAMQDEERPSSYMLGPA